MSQPYTIPARRRNRGVAAHTIARDRLKPISTDPLEDYQLPSKGETRLHDHSRQERYFEEIVDRYESIHPSHTCTDRLETALGALTIVDDATKTTTESRGRPSRNGDPSDPNRLDQTLMAMRKLREGLVGSRRIDDFTARAYMFMIRASILARHWESYHPALLHLLYTIHPARRLSDAELEEFAAYHVLDLTCRQNEPAETLMVMHRFRIRGGDVDVAARAVRRGDWVRFWALRSTLTEYQSSLLSFADDRMRAYALQCIGKAYMQVDRAFVEQSTGSTWPDLVKSGLGWELKENGVVVIRKPKAR